MIRDAGWNRPGHMTTVRFARFKGRRTRRVTPGLKGFRTKRRALRFWNPGPARRTAVEQLDGHDAILLKSGARYTRRRNGQLVRHDDGGAS